MAVALTIDVGTTSIRTALVDESGQVTRVHQRPLTVRTPQPGEVELDAVEIGRLALKLAARTLEGTRCDAVGITNQRLTTVLFDPATGLPVGPAIGWQDLRTVIDCLVLQAEDLFLMPNQSATKARWLVTQSQRRASELRFATLETWIAWLLTAGAIHVTDRSNAGLTGLVSLAVDSWDACILETLDLDPAMMPTIVDTIGHVGNATALTGSPPITALVGDQPASLFGQSCVTRGAKITFGTGAMLDMIRGPEGPSTMRRYASGCFPVITSSRNGLSTWGIEGIVLSAGACLEWLRDDLRLITSPVDSEGLATSVTSTDGVTFVPALSGLGTPQWDFGARGGFFGITRGTTRAHMVRAVLEGIAQRGADLVDAAEVESGIRLDELRVDGGMTANRFFVQSLADATGRPVAVSSELEATTRGAGLMALVGAGHINTQDVEAMWSPAEVVLPRTNEATTDSLRATWCEMIARAQRTIPELSDIEF